MGDHRDVKIRFHSWWNAPKTWAKVQAIDPVASPRVLDGELRAHARAGREAAAALSSRWWTFAKLKVLDPQGARELLGDGNFGGYYEKSDADMDALWRWRLTRHAELLEWK
jgi:creatinine amidohydrolase